jgi:hypothetical protein
VGELKQLIADYEKAVAATDIIDPKELRPIQQGLFGEVGGIMATAKKLVREKSAFPGYRKAAEEEFGDALWYLAAMCRRRRISLADLMGHAIVAADTIPLTGATRPASNSELASTAVRAPYDMDAALMRLGRATVEMLDEQPSHVQMQTFARHFVEALSAADLPLADVVHTNMRKARGAFLDLRLEDLVDFDKDFGPEEQLPRNFRIRINQRASGKSYLQWNGVFIGDPLTDNISDQDGYRFHDVFHFANAAILHWSPVMRALIKQKRKSKGNFDEEQDSGRAIVVEEGLTAWIFSRAKELDYFADQTRVSLGILKTIQEFVAGYEVEQCPLKLWECAILQGYDVFRQLKAAEGGIIVGDREARTLRFEPLEVAK